MRSKIFFEGKGVFLTVQFALQVLWQSTGHTYWVHWHMIEITGFGEQPEEEAAQDKVSSLTENLKLPAGKI